jgi:hypothetical protein
MSVPRVEITIDEIVLRGIPAERRHDVARALEARLGDLVAASITSADGWRSRDESSRRVFPRQLAGGDGEALGAAVAASLHDVLTDRGRR